MWTRSVTTLLALALANAVAAHGQEPVRVDSPEGGNAVTVEVRDGNLWLTNPLPVTISRQPVTAASSTRIALAPGGGQAIRLVR